MILSNSTGTRTWALLRLKGTPQGVDAVKVCRYPEPKPVLRGTPDHFPTTDEAERDSLSQWENALAEDAQNLGYAFYIRKSGSGPLLLQAYDRTKPGLPK
jgi:hypothetical protein